MGSTYLGLAPAPRLSTPPTPSPSPSAPTPSRIEIFSKGMKWPQVFWKQSTSSGPGPSGSTSSTASIIPTDTGSRPPQAGEPSLSIVPSATQKTHLYVLVNGLFGSRANWKVIGDLLESHLDRDTALIHISEANQFKETYHGIDACGRRLAHEIRTIASKNPSLQRISVVGHSMGGLIARYAIGELYIPENQSVAGLRPTHFISMATPHLGCEGSPGPAQVPLVAWTGSVPALGGPLGRVAGAVASPFASIAFGRTGEQFFLLDRDGGRPPLMYRLAHDWPEENLFFLSALRQFDTRTAYANRSGDHLVGWANSSLRNPEELRHVATPPRGGKGVVREDPLEWAWKESERKGLSSGLTAERLDLSHGHTVSVGAIMRAASAEGLVEEGGIGGSGGAGGSKSCIAQEERKYEEGRNQGHGEEDVGDAGNFCVGVVERRKDSELEEDTPALAIAPQNKNRNRNNNIRKNSRTGVAHPDAATAAPAEFIEGALNSLQRLNWRRIDCCFAGAALPLLAHQHLQVQRKWVNWEGMATAKHLAMQLAAMEKLTAERQGEKEMSQASSVVIE